MGSGECEEGNGVRPGRALGALGRSLDAPDGQHIRWVSTFV